MANISAALLTTLLAIGSTVAALTYRDQLHKLDIEHANTWSSLNRAMKADRTATERLVETQKAERQGRLELGKSLQSAGAALERTGLLGQRLDSLDSLGQAGRVFRDLDEGQSRLPDLRDQAIAAMGLTDLRVRWQRNIGLGQIGVDRKLARYALVENRSGETVVRRMDDDRELVRLPRPDVSFWHSGPHFSPDGEYLLVDYMVSGENGLTDVWHLERRERVFQQERRGQVVFHPDGRRLVFAPPGKGLVVWDLIDRRELKRFPLDYESGDLCFDSDGRRIAVCAASRLLQVHILDFDTGAELASWKDQFEHRSMSWSQDGRLLAFGAAYGRVSVWDVERGRLVSVLQGHTQDVIGCRFAPTGHLLATSSWDATTRLWDASSGEPLVSASVDGIGFSTEGRQLAFRNGTTLGVCDVVHGQDVRTLNPGLAGNRTEDNTKSDFVVAARFSPDLRMAALATRDGVYLFDPAGSRELAHLKAGNCDTVLWSADGRSLITYSDRGLFRWPIEPGPEGYADQLRVGPPELLRDGTPATGWHIATWLPDHRTLAAVDPASARVLLVDTSHPHPARRRTRALSSGSNQRLTSFTVSPDGRWAAAGGWKEQGILVWDLARRHSIGSCLPVMLRAIIPPP